jgi:ABC-type multidrug transport system fused ATPase/permease subunit
LKNLLTVFRFGRPYLARYWKRLVLGVLFGILFGISNAAILGVSKTLLERVFPAKTASPTELKLEESKRFQAIRDFGNQLKNNAMEAAEPFLPSAKKPLNATQMAGILVLFPLLFAFRGYIGYLSSYCLGWVSERVISDLRQDVFRKLSTLSLSFFNRSTMGDLIAHINGDTIALQKTLNLGVSDLIKEPITVISTFALLLWMDWKLTLFVMAFLPLCVIPMAVLGRKARKASRGNVKTGVSQQSLLVEFLASIRLVKAYKLEDQQSDRFAGHARQLVHHGMKQIQAKELINPLIETIGALGLGVLMVYILYANKTGGDLAIFIGAVATVYTPVKKLAGLHIMFQQTSVGVDRLMRLLEEQPTVKEPAVPKPLKSFNREIRFDKVQFSYDHRLVLSDFNLVIPRGMKLGVVGESGSGKSTLVNLLLRFYDPQKGRILIDGIDIRDLSTGDLRSQIAMVSQEIVLFDLSVADNIACGKPGATRAEIQAGAEAAYAHDFIMQLPDGYDTRVGDRGVLLSGGQRQRIAIARAFVRQAPLLALDEATAALDAQSEAEVQKAIDHLAEHRTVISVAHRLSTLSKMDKIIVLKSGVIVEEGTFSELLQERGIFGSMADHQTFATSRA